MPRSALIRDKLFTFLLSPTELRERARRAREHWQNLEAACGIRGGMGDGIRVSGSRGDQHKDDKLIAAADARAAALLAQEQYERREREVNALLDRVLRRGSPMWRAFRLRYLSEAPAVMPYDKLAHVMSHTENSGRVYTKKDCRKLCHTAINALTDAWGATIKESRLRTNEDRHRAEADE